MDAISASQRLEILRTRMSDHDCYSAVITSLHDIRWLSGFSGSNAIVVVTPADAVLLTDHRYEQQIIEEVVGLRAVCVRGNLVDHIPLQIGYGRGEEAGLPGIDNRVDAVLVDPESTTAAVLERLRNLDGQERKEFRLIGGWLASARAVKQTEELAAMRRAQAITDDVFSQLLALIKPGMTELEINAEIVYRHLRLGAERMSFDPIVASGPNGALPHARPGNRAVRAGDLVVIDMGCIVDGYASDMTRTIAIGTPPAEAAQAYDAVLRAQAAAIAAARAGMTGSDLDSVARDSLKADQLDAFFVHSLGHGVGLEVHEWPRVSAISDDVLPVGCVVTVEPGVYLPGRFGIRIEDMIVVQKAGCDNLTGSSSELYIIG